MLSARVGAAALMLTALAACDAPKPPGVKPDPDFASIRTVSWTNTAQELAGFPATSDGTRATIYGFGDSVMGGPTSAVSGDVVLSGVWTDRVVIVAGQSAKTGEILWRRSLTTRGGDADCQDDNGGPIFICKVSVGEKQVTTLWVIADRTGAVRRKIPVDPATSYGVSGDELYLATFKPARKDTRLDVAITRRSLMGKRTEWTRKTSFAIEGWGHDGSSGFDIGRDRVVAHSASWLVIVDRATGRLLERADNGRWEDELSNGGRVVLDSGDGTSEHVDVTLISPDGRPVADFREEMYPITQEVEPDRIILGRHLVSLATGRAVFTAPRHHTITAVTAKGRVAIVEPNDADRIRVAVYDTVTGRRTGSFSLSGDAPGDSIAGGNGVIKVVQRYDHKSGDNLPPVLHVIDVRKPGGVATIKLGDPQKDNEYMPPTLVRTRHGVVVTGAGAVRGLVTR